MAQVVTVTGDEQTSRLLRQKGITALHLEPVMDEQGKRAVRQVSGIPKDTGRLAASIEVLDTSDHGFDVGSRVPYARFVFGGTKYMDARPPRVNTDAIARNTADAINRELRA